MQESASEIIGNQAQTLKQFRKWGQGQLDGLQKLQFTPSQAWELSDSLSRRNAFKIVQLKENQLMCVVRSGRDALYQRTIDNQRLDSVAEELGELGCTRSYDTYVGNLYGDRDERRALSELQLEDCQERSQRTEYIPCRSFATFVDQVYSDWLVTIYVRDLLGELSTRSIRCTSRQAAQKQIDQLHSTANRAGLKEVGW